MEERLRSQECRRGRGAEATWGQVGAHTLHGGVDVEGVRICWNGLKTVSCDHHSIVSTYCFTRVSSF